MEDSVDEPLSDFPLDRTQSFAERWAQIGNRPPKEESSTMKRPSSQQSLRRPASQQSSLRPTSQQSQRPASQQSMRRPSSQQSISRPTSQQCARPQPHSSLSPTAEQRSVTFSMPNQLNESASDLGGRPLSAGGICASSVLSSSSSFTRLSSSVKLQPKNLEKADWSQTAQLRRWEPGDPARFHNGDAGIGRVEESSCRLGGFTKPELVAQGLESYHQAFNKAGLKPYGEFQATHPAHETDSGCQTPCNLTDLWQKPDSVNWPVISSGLDASPGGGSVSKEFMESVGSSLSDFARPVSAPASFMCQPRDKDSVAFCRCAKGQILEVGASESDAFGLHKPGANIDRERAKQMEKLYRRDPPLAQFLDCISSAFGTLSLAFRYLDLQRHGSVTKKEFTESLLHGSPPGSKNPQPVQEHLNDIFDRLDIKKRGFTSLKNVLDQLDGEQPVMQRLAEFLVQMVASKRVVSFRGQEATRRTRLEQCMWATGLGMASRITREDFASWLKQLKYPSWHLGDIFQRLSIDGSNALTLEDFISAFGKVRQSRPPETPLPEEMQEGDGENGRKASKGKHVNRRASRSACETSVKLGKGRSDKLPLKPVLGLLKSGWFQDHRGDLCLDRPDHLGHVRDNLQAQGRSKMFQTQSHQVFSHGFDKPFVPSREATYTNLAESSIEIDTRTLVS